jgi:hypothetical protein
MTTLTALPETVRGLPLHVLVVHAVVVLVPLAAVGALLSAVWPAVRRQFGALAVAAAAVATVLVPIATGSGENFERRLGAEELVKNHSSWAGRMLPTMIVLLVAVVALVLVDIVTRSAELASVSAVPAGVGGGPAEAPERRDAPPLTVVDRRVAAVMPASLRSAAADGRLRTVNVVLAVVVVIVALIALYVCFQTGESGARAAWGGR